MDSVKIKICGITNSDDALACAEAGADYLGFIFYEGSPRAITPRRAAGIIAALPGSAIPVGVFVNEDPGVMEKAIADSGVRMVQLCGEEPPEAVRRIQLPVIKVFRAPAGSAPYHHPDDYRLFACMVDGATPGAYGGSGAEPDLALARRLAAGRRLFLAGGLHHENVAGMIGAVRPYAVDVNSGTERRPGVKDHRLVRLFCENVRSCNAH